MVSMMFLFLDPYTVPVSWQLYLRNQIYLFQALISDAALKNDTNCIWSSSDIVCWQRKGDTI